MSRVVRFAAWELWLPIALIALWWFGSAGATSIYFPPLERIVTAFQTYWLFDHVAIDLAPSLQRLAIGYTGAVVIGITVGLLLGLLRPLEFASRPILEFSRAVPGVALIPIAMIVFGVGQSMKISLIVFVAAWPVLLNTIEGVRSVEPVLLDVSRSFRMPPAYRLRYVILPGAAPQIAAGARVALEFAIVVMVVVEMVGTPGGIGYFILDAQRSYDLPRMWSGVIALGIFGYLLNNAFRLAERLLLGWHLERVALSQKGS